MMTTEKTDIRGYWNKRAHDEASGGQRLTTNDWYLRELEARTFIQEITKAKLPAGACLLDAGCGDGLTTIRVAEAFPDHLFTGFDYAENMVAAAVSNLKTHPDLDRRVQFRSGDVLSLREPFSKSCFDAVLSDRCLINLTSLENQRKAFHEIAGVLRPGGYYFAVENFMEGQDNMNRARRELGLAEITVRWHNLFFTEKTFRAASEADFEILSFQDFASGYYFATRLVYSAFCQKRGEEPDYGHDIHKLAVDLPATGQFSPVRMVILRRKTS